MKKKKYLYILTMYFNIDENLMLKTKINIINNDYNL